MKVIIAKNSGFCFGVRRAVEESIKIANAYTLGPLIHNLQTIKELEKKGIKAVNSIDQIKKGTLIIRTHGVPESIIKKAIEKNLKVIDLTCPFVKNAQNCAKKFYKEGYKVVIIGEANHPEVIGIKENIKNAIVIEKPNDAKKLGFHNKLGVVVQTTQTKENVKSIVEKLKNKCKELKIAKTICNSTIQRQNLSTQLAKKVDLMLVIGGKNSANTKRLYDLCKKIVKTKKIESEKELKKEWFKNKKIIGITAGTSTPKWLVKKISVIIKNEF